MTEVTGRNKRNDDTKKLTRILSTKLSIEDYERFQKFRNFAYKNETMTKLRIFVTSSKRPFYIIGMKK